MFIDTIKNTMYQAEHNDKEMQIWHSLHAKPNHAALYTHVFKRDKLVLIKAEQSLLCFQINVSYYKEDKHAFGFIIPSQ